MQKTTCQTTTYRESLRERILLSAVRTFMSKGIKAAKMDDIARELSISKRTLYEIYHNKEDLLLECVKYECQMDERTMSDFVRTMHPNVMEVFLKFYHMRMVKYSHATPQYLEGINKYERVMNFLAQKHEQHLKDGQNFFRRGVKEGFFRSDFDYKIIAAIGEAAMQRVVHSRLYKQYPLQLLFHNVIYLFLRGFCTEKGLRVLDRLPELTISQQDTSPSF